MDQHHAIETSRAITDVLGQTENMLWLHGGRVAIKGHFHLQFRQIPQLWNSLQHMLQVGSGRERGRIPAGRHAQSTARMEKK